MPPFRRVLNSALPIFCQEQDSYTIFYAPGYLVVVAPASADAFVSSLAAPELGQKPAAASLVRRATAAQAARTAVTERPYAPVCLTLYLNNECNLRCVYCYTIPSRLPAPQLSLPAIRTAAEIVLRNCQRQQRPFTLVCHGGGEPTLNRHLLNQVLYELEKMAAAYKVPLFRYVATNGVMSTEKARWLARRFDLIGLSCDGPETIQARQRPLWSGDSSAPFVERTAQVIHHYGKSLHVRVTVTPESAPFQPEIARYICRELQPEEIHAEPVYRAGRARTASGFGLDEVDGFVAHFLEARAVAGQAGVRWLTSGSRLGEVHGRYCHLFRDVLNLVPGGAATACFKATDAAEAHQKQVTMGQMAGEDGRFVLDQAQIDTLRGQLSEPPPQCRNCFNQFHCAYTCPDNCPLESPAMTAQFRCRVQRQLMTAMLQEKAQTYWTNKPGELDIIEIDLTAQ